MKKTLIILFLILSFSACKKQVQVSSGIVSGNDLKKAVQRGVNGIKPAADSLSGLIENSLTAKTYTKLIVDSLILSSGKFFSVLIEYPDTINSRFGIYNDSLRCLLIDKSLRGNLSEKVLNINNSKFININEGFFSKNVLIVNRLSLYEINKNVARLVFRTFTRLKKPDAEYTQTIEQISKDQIVTKINGIEDIQADIFPYNNSSEKYAGEHNFFDNFVIEQINNYQQD